MIEMAPQAEIEIRKTPWMSPSAVKLFSELLSQCSTYLEYGAGGSTRFAAQTQLSTLISVESDPRFLSAVDFWIRQDAPHIAWHPIAIDIGPTGPLGYPKSLRPNPSWLRYPLTPWARGFQPDLILIDGRFRLACALAASEYAAPGTLVMIDDYALRPWYWKVRRVMKEVRRAGRARVFEVSGNSSELTRHALRRACGDPR